MGRDLLSKGVKTKTLATNLRRNVGRLQVAIMRENKHEICTHLGMLIEQSEELVQAIDEAPAIAQ